MKKQTYEEAAERYRFFWLNNKTTINQVFIDGAKWQQEQDNNKFSEEDLKLAFETGRNFQLTGENNFNELIEKLKKK